MILADYHVHTLFCDGKNTPEDMVLSAIDKGLNQIGILAHSYVEFDKEGTIAPDKVNEFITLVNDLAEKYSSKILVLCGIERDACSSETLGFDYVIGSTHYWTVNGKNLPIDLSEELFVKTVNEEFYGDYLLAAESYFESEKQVVIKTKADIIGHFDIIAKYNKNNKYFDESSPRYVNAWKSAVDELIKYNKPFEINTGSIFRGRRNEPFPSVEIIEYIKKSGGKLVLSSDAHCADGVAFEFDKWKKYL